MANPSSLLRHRVDGSRMNIGIARIAIIVVLFLASVATWAFAMWAALQVSTVVLKTLEQIVDLAAMN